MKLMTVNTLVGIVQNAQAVDEIIHRYTSIRMAGHTSESLADLFACGLRKEEALVLAHALQSLIAAAKDLGDAPAAAGFLGRTPK